jgi:hypothetical protein
LYQEHGASYVDKLALEVSQACKRSCVPESTLSAEQSLTNALIMGTIGRIDEDLERSTDCNAGPTLLLFRRAIMTPSNLEAILRMIDADVHTGEIRCFAFHLLSNLTMSSDSIWNVKMNDGTRFSTCLISAYAKALDDETKNEIRHRGNCGCYLKCWGTFKQALLVTKDEPAVILSRIHSYSWTDILERPNDSAVWFDGMAVYSDTKGFNLLHKVGVRVLQEEGENSQAEAFLQKLGACQELFRRVLRRVVAGDMLWKGSGSGTFILGIEDPSNFFVAFFNSLTRLPSDPETDALMRQAHSSIRMAFTKSLSDPTAFPRDVASLIIDHINSLLLFMSDPVWSRLKTESDQQQRQRFRQKYCSAESSTWKKTDQHIRLGYLRRKKDDSNGGNEMCGNCYLLEKDLDGKLMKCMRCHQICYCSRKCQTAHWKKVHKKLCKK